jgi:hypothetical protein
MHHARFARRAVIVALFLVGPFSSSPAFSAEPPPAAPQRSLPGTLPITTDADARRVAEPGRPDQAPARAATLPRTGVEIFALIGGAIFFLIIGFFLFWGGRPGGS